MRGIPAHWRGASAKAVAEFEAVWRALLPLAWKVQTSLILADYHVDNLLLLPERAA